MDCLKSDIEKENQSESQVKRLETSEVDILIKAYELILDNSDLFYMELADAFINQRDKRNNMLI